MKALQRPITAAASPPVSALTHRSLVAAGVLAALLLAAQAFPAAVSRLFCAPSAWLSSQFLGVAWFPMSDGYRLDCARLPVDVTLACSGTTFFALLFAVLRVNRGGKNTDACAATPHSITGLKGVLGSLVLAYLTTLAANTARIVLGWHAALWAHASLSPSFHPGVHLAVGIVVFSGFLLAGALADQWFFATRSETNESARAPSSGGLPPPSTINHLS